MGNSDRRRKAGRPKLRWLGCIENDLNQWVSRDGERRQKTGPHGLLFRRKHWLNSGTYANDEDYILC